MNKILITFICIALFITVGVFIHVQKKPIITNNSNDTIDCSKTGSIALTKSEINHTQEILKRYPGLLVQFPEDDKVIGTTAALNCNNFDLSHFVQEASN